MVVDVRIFAFVGTHYVVASCGRHGGCSCVKSATLPACARRRGRELSLCVCPVFGLSGAGLSMVCAASSAFALRAVRRVRRLVTSVACGGVVFAIFM